MPSNIIRKLNDDGIEVELDFIDYEEFLKMTGTAENVNWMGRSKESKDDWETPDYFFDLLNREFNFTVDVAATFENSKCTRFMSEISDSLIQNWKGERAFCNPPFKDIDKWSKKCLEEGEKDDTIVVLLLPSRTDTQYWHNYIMKAKALWFCVGRVNFLINKKLPKKGGSNFPLSVVIFGKDLDKKYWGIRSFHHKEYKKEYEEKNKIKVTKEFSIGDSLSL